MPASIAVDVPVLETEHLRLRGHRRDDFAACVKMWSDPAVTRFIGGVPSTPQRTWSRLLSYVGHWALVGFGYWVIETKDANDFVGEVGFADFKRDIDESMRDVPELGFALVPEFHGKGLATEAVRAVLAWGDAHLESTRTVCLIDAANAASIRVVKRCGYEVFAETTLDKDAVLFLARNANASQTQPLT